MLGDSDSSDNVHEVSIHLRCEDTWVLILERVMHFKEQYPRRLGNGVELPPLSVSLHQCYLSHST